MPPKKSNLNNASSKGSRRKRVERAQQLPEQIETRNAAQRIRTAESRAQESQEQRDERLQKNITRTRAARKRNIATVRIMSAPIISPMTGPVRSYRLVSRSNSAKQVCIQKLIASVLINNQFIPNSNEDLTQERCPVAACSSHISKTPFVPFPHKFNLINKWTKCVYFKLGMVKKLLQKNKHLYICCNHFDLQYDVLNYDQWIKGLEPAIIDERAFPRFNMIVKKFEVCFFPKCYNVSCLYPNMVFFEVPQVQKVRSQWFEAVGRIKIDYVKRYCCEEHFDMKNDVIKTFSSINVKYGVLPRLKSQILKESVNKKKKLEQLKEEKLKLSVLYEEKISLNDHVFWMTTRDKYKMTENIENKIKKLGVLTDEKVKEMFLLSLYSDLKEMSYSQLDVFKLKVIQIIKSIRS